MKKLSFWLTAGVAVLALGFASCDGGEDDPLPTPPVTGAACDTLVYPTTDGDATVEILNFDIANTIMVEAGSDLALAVQITRGTNRAQKVRLFQSDCINSLGEEVDLSDQPKGGRNGIDLRRTDNAQVRDVIYSVPASGFSEIFLTVEVDEVDDKSVYTQIKLMVSGSGIVDTFTDVTLGGNSNVLASRMSSASGQTYTACNAAENINSIDITYAVNTDASGQDWLCSNPARFEAPIGFSLSTAQNCGEDENGVEQELMTDGGNPSYFAATTVDFDSATNTELAGLAVSNTSAQNIEVTGADQVIAFMNSNGRKGLIRVSSVEAGTNTAKTNGSITISLKIQR